MGIFKCPFGPENSKLSPKHKSPLASYNSCPLRFCESVCKVSIYLLKDKGCPIHSDNTQPETKTILQVPTPHPDPMQPTPLSSKPQNRGGRAQETCKHPFLEQLALAALEVESCDDYASWAGCAAIAVTAA